jgi:putative FmdB family regulatory protein
MPIFEYQCKNCNTKYEILHKSSANLEEVVCPECHSKDSKKLLSTFSASMGSSSNYSGESCSTGTCGLPSGGCANGMCGLN